MSALPVAPVAATVNSCVVLAWETMLGPRPDWYLTTADRRRGLDRVRPSAQ
jgi:hypothetical protein